MLSRNRNVAVEFCKAGVATGMYICGKGVGVNVGLKSHRKIKGLATSCPRWQRERRSYACYSDLLSRENWGLRKRLKSFAPMLVALNPCSPIPGCHLAVCRASKSYLWKTLRAQQSCLETTMLCCHCSWGCIQASIILHCTVQGSCSPSRVPSRYRDYQTWIPCVP